MIYQEGEAGVLFMIISGWGMKKGIDFDFA
jgi:hypothetical protein